MKLNLQSTRDVGLLVRVLRKQASIRIDDFAQTAGVSKQFMTDLEHGKPTIQMGRVLDLLAHLGMRLSVEVSEETDHAFRLARSVPPKVRARRKPSADAERH